ncbi:MAG: GAF domain-containing sensor histidine kinase [Chloroflexi bacterium]|nr:GAF domain-containing sensor histidine kinase [Chloroflexota bacterium]
MQNQLGQRSNELASQAVTLETLYEIGMGLSALLEASTIKETAVQRARNLFASDAAGLAILNESNGEVRWRLVAGDAGGNLESINLQLGQGLIGKAIQSGQVMMVKDAQRELGSEDLAAIDPGLGETKLRAVLVVPVRIAGKPIGALMVGYNAPHSFRLRDIRLLTGLANHVAVAINNARMLEQLSALSALEERQRLAREMHDGLAQMLGSITAQATATRELLAQGKTQAAQGQLTGLQEVALKAYVDVRQSILGLRTPSIRMHGLLDALNEYIGGINKQQEIPVRLESLEGAPIQGLAPAVEVQGIRIIQEAIHNVQKHSRAQAASIKIYGDGEWLTIEIQDNGLGFDVDETYDRGSHFGLQMMRERAESVGGHLDIESSRGRGTSLLVRLPVETRR